MTTLARKQAERMLVAQPEQQPGLIVQALEKAIRAEESGKAAHARMDEMRGEVRTLTERVGDVAESVGNLREHVDLVVNDVKVEVGKQGVRVALIVAGISLLASALIAIVAGVIVYVLTH